ncbi:MAG: SGNH/GDSL hydrolase family protein [Candidatus Hydrogenedentes bacterium]|nr:SGNH/GDSL hydrolase family protein [Candidatus Hydrogenedentota bacterium]
MTEPHTQPVNRSQGCLINAAVLVAACVVALLLLEGGARLLLEAPPPAHSDFRTDHATRLWTNTPGLTQTINLEEYGGLTETQDGKTQFTVHHSEQGWRNAPIGPKQAGEYRILMLGDSFTWGYGVDDDETIPAALQRCLDETQMDRPLTVINAGVLGYGPWQVRLLLEEEGLALQPDLVILQTFTNNDFDDSLLQKGKYFRAYHEAKVERQHAFMRRRLWHVALQRTLREHSRVYQTLVRATDRENLLANTLERIGLAPADPHPLPPPSEDRNTEIESSLKEWYPELDEAWELFQNDVSAIARNCAARKIDFVVYCVPGMDYYFDPYWSEYTKNVGGDLYERGKVLRLIEQFFADEKLPHVSVADALGNEDPLVYYQRWNKHLTVRGCDVAARQLCDFLRTKHWPARHAAGQSGDAP